MCQKLSVKRFYSKKYSPLAWEQWRRRMFQTHKSQRETPFRFLSFPPLRALLKVVLMFCTLEEKPNWCGAKSTHWRKQKNETTWIRILDSLVFLE
ncbi:hypothetical protein I3760_14G044200 [Carya illinoinensis]|nr:hypothetical protein I3760_14G044200 [Carya illinoinensis]